MRSALSQCRLQLSVSKGEAVEHYNYATNLRNELKKLQDWLSSTTQAPATTCPPCPKAKVRATMHHAVRGVSVLAPGLISFFFFDVQLVPCLHRSLVLLLGTRPGPYGTSCPCSSPCCFSFFFFFFCFFPFPCVHFPRLAP